MRKVAALMAAVKLVFETGVSISRTFNQKPKAARLLKNAWRPSRNFREAANQQKTAKRVEIFACREMTASAKIDINVGYYQYKCLLPHLHALRQQSVDSMRWQRRVLTEQVLS